MGGFHRTWQYLSSKFNGLDNRRQNASLSSILQLVPFLWIFCADISAEKVHAVKKISFCYLSDHILFLCAFYFDLQKQYGDNSPSQSYRKSSRDHQRSVANFISIHWVQRVAYCFYDDCVSLSVRQTFEKTEFLFCLEQKKVVMLLLVLVLNLKGFIQYTFLNHWPWQFDRKTFFSSYHPMLGNRSEEAFRQGFVVCYLWHHFYDRIFSTDLYPIEYPGTINVSIPTQNDIPKNKYNIIIIQVESLAKQVIDLKSREGIEFTPFLNKLKKNSRYFENFYSQHGGGYSGDSELALYLGFIPLDTHQGMSTANKNLIKKDNLIALLKKSGYETAVMHSNRGTFFNRRQNYAEMGIDHFWDSRHYQGKALGLTTTQDADFLLQSIPKIKSLKKPFFAHLITLQSHGSFKNYEQKKLEQIDFSHYNNITKNYLASIHEVDDALEGFFKAMKSEGILNNSIVFLYSDHHPGMGVEFEKTCPDECIPFFIYAPEFVQAGTVQTLGTHLDIAPTILDILGIDLEQSPKWFGSNLLNNFPNGQIALLPRYKGLVLENNGILKRISTLDSKFLKFYQYRRSILESD